MGRAKCVGYMGLIWAGRRNNTHTQLTQMTQPITRQLAVAFLQSGSFLSVFSVVLLYCIRVQRFLFLIIIDKPFIVRKEYD